MSQQQRNGAAAGDEWSGTPLILGAGMDLEARDDGVYVRILTAPQDAIESARDAGFDVGHLCETHTPETWDTLYQKVVERDFYKSQTYLEIANTLSERAGDRGHIPGGRLANKFRERCEALAAHDDEAQEKLRSPTAGQLLQETQSVEFRIVGGDGHVAITIEHEGKETTIDYDPDEWLNSTGAKFASAYWGAFFVELELDPEDWVYLKEQWKDQAVEVGGDEYGELEAVSEEIIDTLQRRLDVYSDREAVQNGTYAAWFEASPDGRASLPDDDDGGPIVWVRTIALGEVVTGAGHTHGDIPEIIDHLQQEDVIRTDRKNLDNKRVHGWDPGTNGLDIDEDMVGELDSGRGDGHGVDL